MINAWSLLYEELNGTMAKTYPIEDNDMSPCKLDGVTFTTADDPIVTVGSGNTAASTHTYCVDTTQMGDIKIDTSALDNEHITIDGGDTVVNFDDIVFTDTAEYETLNLNTSTYSGFNIPDSDIPLPQNFLADNDDSIAHHITTSTPGIEKDCPRKYKED